MTANEVQIYMGTGTTEDEAAGMIEILRERGLDVNTMRDEDFLALIPEAVERVSVQGGTDESTD